MRIAGNIVDILSKEIYGGEIEINNGIITSIIKTSNIYKHYILPGFIDAHIHIESSLMVPSEFAKIAVLHGTLATVSDPHEIANVCGIKGIEFMIENGKAVPFKFFFGAPSCVPATTFETAGAVINAYEVNKLLTNSDIWYLSEMMNFPGVLNNDKEVMKKIGSAQKHNKPIDGHAPGLRGNDAKKYFDAGISTDHECFTLEEAEEKIKLGVKVIIREGSAARNFDALIALLEKYPDSIMFCSDDKHPDELLEGHINKLVAKAIEKGFDLFDVLKAACINPVLHYNLPVGYLKINHPADLIVVDNLKEFNVLKTFINGNLVAENGKCCFSCTKPEPINNFGIDIISTEEIQIEKKEIYDVIECIDGQLITNRLNIAANDCTLENDILKMVVVNRYCTSKIAVAYVKNFGLTKGAIASSVAHDSHNIIAVGADDNEIVNAINLIIRNKGGLSACNKNELLVLPLDIGGLMSSEPGILVAQQYSKLHHFAKQKLGSTLRAPFMSLSFMALLVIPHLKLSDLGLFDCDTFKLI